MYSYLRAKITSEFYRSYEVLVTSYLSDSQLRTTRTYCLNQILNASKVSCNTLLSLFSPQIPPAGGCFELEPTQKPHTVSGISSR